MKENYKTPFTVPADDVMSYKGLSAYLKMSQGTLRQKVINGRIPFFKIDEWLEEKHRGTKNNEQ